MNSCHLIYYVETDDVQRQIHKRGIQTVTGLGRYYRTLDQYNTGMLDQYDLEKGLKTFHINLDQKVRKTGRDKKEILND